MESLENRDRFSEIEDYFVTGLDPEDITPLWSLKQKLPLIDAFITVFHGTVMHVLIRLLVLAEMVSKVDPPVWPMSELRYVFGYLSETAFDTVLRRLRDGGLISYDREANSYTVTSLGQKLHGAISMFLKGEDDEGIGMLTGLVYAGEVMGTLGKEELGHLLYRLNQLEGEIIYAVESASEYQILKARDRYEAIWKYIQKGTDIIKKITKNADFDRTTHGLAQQIGHAQSRLAKFTSVFQRALNDIDRQRVHLGNSGVSTSDLSKYLMNRSINELIGLMSGTLGTTINPTFVLTDIMADKAEYELIERERQSSEDFVLPDLADSPASEDLFEDLNYLQELHSDVSSVTDAEPLKSIIPRNNFEESAYRLSMISLIGDRGEVSGSHIHDFINLPFIVSFGSAITEVMEYDVKSMSDGSILRVRTGNDL